ncbi:hypothetical protein CXG81DRAFT_29006, partial [Caulochytrium protostelioides]
MNPNERMIRQLQERLRIECKIKAGAEMMLAVRDGSQTINRPEVEAQLRATNRQIVILTAQIDAYRGHPDADTLTPPPIRGAIVGGGLGRAGTQHGHGPGPGHGHGHARAATDLPDASPNEPVSAVAATVVTDFLTAQNRAAALDDGLHLEGLGAPVDPDPVHDPDHDHDHDHDPGAEHAASRDAAAAAPPAEDRPPAARDPAHR